MQDPILNNLLSKFIHDILSPISAVSLAFEAISDTVDQETADFMDSALRDFRNITDLMKLLVNTANTINFDNVCDVITNNALKKDVTCNFQNFPKIITGKFVKTLVALYCIARKDIIKHGSIKFEYKDNDTCHITVHSKYPIHIQEQIETIKKTQSNIDINPNNIDFIFALQLIQNSGKKLEIMQDSESIVNIYLNN